MSETAKLFILSMLDSPRLIILKKRLTPEGKEIFGPILRNFKKKKFLSSFSGLI